MATREEQVEGQFTVKQYRVQYPISAYTFPHEARIHHVRFDAEYMSRTMIIWDPEKCAINDEVCIADYLHPGREET